MLFAVLPYIALINGVIFTGLGFYLLSAVGDINRNSEEILVQVTKIITKKAKNGILCKPQFEFKSTNGEKIEYSGKEWVQPCPHREGEIILAKYSESTGKINSNSMVQGKFWSFIITLQIGAFGIILGVFWHFMRRKINRLQAIVDEKT